MKFENKTEEKIKVQKDVKAKFNRSEWQTVRPGETIEANNAVFCKYYVKAGLTDISKEVEKEVPKVPEKTKDEKVKEKPEEKPEELPKVGDEVKPGEPGYDGEKEPKTEEKPEEPKKIRPKRKTKKE